MRHSRELIVAGLVSASLVGCRGEEQPEDPVRSKGLVEVKNTSSVPIDITDGPNTTMEQPPLRRKIEPGETAVAQCITLYSGLFPYNAKVYVIRSEGRPPGYVALYSKKLSNDNPRQQIKPGIDKLGKELDSCPQA